MKFLWLSLGALAVYQGIVLAQQYEDVSTKYDLAMAAATHRGKPLLVASGPYGSPRSRLIGFAAHGCGDICLDIDPAACRTCNFVCGSITEIPFRDKSFGAVFASHILEHMPTLEACERAWSELHRVADEVFICVPRKSNLIAWLHPDHHLWITETSVGLQIEERAGLHRVALVSEQFDMPSGQV